MLKEKQRIEIIHNQIKSHLFILEQITKKQKWVEKLLNDHLKEWKKQESFLSTKTPEKRDDSLEKAFSLYKHLKDYNRELNSISSEITKDILRSSKNSSLTKLMSFNNIYEQLAFLTFKKSELEISLKVIEEEKLKQKF